MLKVIAVLLALGILLYGVMTFLSGPAALGDPVTASASQNLKTKAQAEISLTVTGMSNRIRQVMAAGNDPAQRQPVLDDLAALHHDVDAATERLSTLGESPEAIEHWLGLIRWPEFLALEKQFTAAVTTP